MNKCGTDIEKAGKLVKEGGLVIFPTETVYGLGANALLPEAVENIFKAKERPAYDPLIVHIDSINKIDQVVSDFPEKAQKLAEEFWPGPLTIILPKSEQIPYIVTSNLDSVGVRIPSHPVALEFLKEADCPVAGPSANKFGYISPTKSSHLDDLLESVNYLLDGGNCEVGIESTIISLVDEPTILRKGKIDIDEIEAVIGCVKMNVNSSSRPEAPGMLIKHYSPKTEMNIYQPDIEYQGKIAFVAFGSNTPEIKFNKVVNLSESSNMAEAAEKLYSTLRDLDSEGFDMILTSYIDDKGIGKAINDKIKRATA